MKRHWTLFMGLVLVLLLIVFAAQKFYVQSIDYTLTERNFTKDALAVVATHSELRLPEKSRGLNMVYVGSRGDPAFVAKVLIPADGLDDLQQQIEKCANQDYDPIGALSENVPWWNPSKLKVVVDRKYTVKSSYVHVLLCHENQQLVLFVESLSF